MRLARVQQVLTLGALMLALIWLLGWWQRGEPVWAVAGAAAVLFGHAAVLGLEFVLMARINRDDAAPRAGLGQLLRAWWGESVSAPRVFCWRQPFRSRALADHLPATAEPGRGVVFVHGFVCNRGLWNPWLRQLRAQGRPFVAVDLEPVFGSIDDYAPIIEAAVAKLESATGLAPVIVAHSMGGLAVRRWLSTTRVERAHHVITLGTPHHGTWLARLALTINSRQMQRASRWIEQLATSEPADLAQRFTCFYSHCDNIVFPASTATLPGADNRHLSATAHVHMTDHPAPRAELMRRLG
jgi:pimeloyl-ACP methyl ester carboxylesterase